MDLEQIRARIAALSARMVQMGLRMRDFPPSADFSMSTSYPDVFTVSLYAIGLSEFGVTHLRAASPEICLDEAEAMLDAHCRAAA